MKAKPTNAPDGMHALRKRLRTTGNDTRRSETTTDSDAVRALDLRPGFRDRLIESLNEVGVPARGRMAYVASLTDRAVQTVSRWLDPREPGLPDLESCARLCDGLGRNSDWMLGLAEEPRRTGAVSPTEWTAETAWAREAFDVLRQGSGAGEIVRMTGDEMAPLICDGDLMFVDSRANQLVGNGIYALELDGRCMVRRVDSRLGTGLVFKCDNERYPERVVKDAAAARRLGLRVIGKVRAAIGVTHFWQA